MSNFKAYKAELRANVATLLTGNNVLFHTNVGGEELWQWFIDSLPEELRAEYQCNACRHFIKHFGGLVAIGQNNVTRNMWQFETQQSEFEQVNDVLANIVAAAQIRDVFVPSYDQSSKDLLIGVDFNIAQIHDENNKPTGQTQRWEHLSFQLPSNYFFPRTAAPEPVKAKRRDHANVLKSSLEKITLDAVQTIKELIAQNSLYRGEENLHALTEFAKLKEVYDAIPSTVERANFCWKAAVSNKPESVLRFKNTVIGTLAEDISEGTDLDTAVKKFEQKVAPANYKRPTALVTPRMVADAEKTVNELGIADALPRRLAVPEDLNVTNALFVNRNVTKDGRLSSMSLLGTMLTKEQTVNPKSFSKVELIKLVDFVKNVLPTAAGVELLLENKHESQLVSLIAPVNAEANPLFKWNNPFSWSYNKALADGIKEKVKAAGGNIDAVLRMSLSWNEDGQSICDLDLHAKEPGGAHIYYGQYRGSNQYAQTPQSGCLDVDMINPRQTGIENITWTNQAKMKPGTYRMEVNNFNSGRNNGCRCEIEVAGERYELNYNKHLGGTVHIADVVYDNKGFTVVPAKGIEVNGTIQGKQIWSLTTMSFVPVSAVTYSPNYWNEEWKGTGNKHVFFFLQGAKNDGLVRGFFNEMLTSELDKHRRVFETLAGKLTVEPAEHELSGVGFATTGDHEFVVKVKGNSGLERILRVVA